MATNTPSLTQYLAYWLREVVEPNLRPLTAATYETTVRLYIVPLLGSKRLDRLTVQDMRGWLNKLADTCQCCAQGKDAKRPEDGGGAAPWGSAADRRSRSARSMTPGPSFAARSPMPWSRSASRRTSPSLSRSSGPGGSGRNPGRWRKPAPSWRTPRSGGTTSIRRTS
ncbi:N-terminal phage integrase SAM-like domain-containing protein [Streptomyces sp. NPDC002688]|uniref:N-terminal phage integrase SAM-like domain-containing protein n=1 Tax=Streptomyces sp. NPDC002688 TaxID=3154423 RepID=UPI003320786C